MKNQNYYVVEELYEGVTYANVSHKRELEITVGTLLKEGKSKEQIKDYLKSFPTVYYDEPMDKYVDKLLENKKIPYGSWKLTPEIEKDIRENFKTQKEADSALFDVFGMGFDDGTEKGNMMVKDFNSIMKAIANIYGEKPFKEYKSVYAI